MRFFGGDFMSRTDSDAAVKALCGQRHNEKSMRPALTSISQFSDIFGTITIENMLSLAFEEKQFLYSVLTGLSKSAYIKI